ncbi:FHA domain-containing protein [Bradymonas sediminis]|uniref:Uncharacterized protein n=1 Tax=Bradymonas sediminis TaxID=1548548 RepID=A0A2Z4FL10_9DELT|nr:FHA domain-containing protein [Bradymonas sediminis]AWV89582.1 hypothetical protein DN745_09630 [Bradymonas sediminis]TDP76684.1 pSer/pThr/pTyr-binding forkhead associated (FHA) protein [Bradymonas sediminis]
MAKSSDSNIQDLGGTLEPLSEPNPYPFELGPQPDDGVISSLDSRRELLDLTRDLLARTHGQPGNYRQPVVRPSAAQPSAQPTGPRPVLAVHSPGGTIETTHPVDSARYLVGRENCDLELDDRFVARWHVQLFRRDGALILQDLNSKNGVYLRIADDLPLEDGDRIAIGEQRFEFRNKWDRPAGQKDGDSLAAGATWAGPPARLIRYLEGGQIGGVYPLAQYNSIGSQKSDLTFPDDTFLSPTHAVIHCESERYYLRDHDSDFGTFIRIADAVELVDGDCFLVGRTRIRLTFSSPK